METTILIAIIVGLTEVLKRTFKISSRYIPIISLAIGIGIAFLTGGESTTTIIVGGIIAGLTASGLYSGTKAVIGK